MNTNDEIEKILEENPIETKPKIQTYGKAKGSNVFSKIYSKVYPKRKKIVIAVIVILALFTTSMFLPVNQCECETYTVCDICTQDLSIGDIKQQIITKGYADVDGLKLSPYTG